MVYNSLNNLKVQSSKSPLRFMQSLNCNPLKKIKIKRQITYFQHHRIYITILKCHSEEILDQSKTGNQLGKLQTLHLQSTIQIYNSLHLC